MILGRRTESHRAGIEFDYCCVHAALALREDGFETIMVNCNPETVSTDYDTSDRLYFEPLTLEDVLEILEKEKPEGVIVQFGGQDALEAVARVGGGRSAIIGTSPRLNRCGGRIASASSCWCATWASSNRRTRRRATRSRQCGWRAKSAFRSWCDRRMCSVAGPWKWCSPEEDLRTYMDGGRARLE